MVTFPVATLARSPAAWAAGAVPASSSTHSSAQKSLLNFMGVSPFKKFYNRNLYNNCNTCRTKMLYAISPKILPTVCAEGRILLWAGHKRNGSFAQKVFLLILFFAHKEKNGHPH
jgi:hypothetical protein